MFLQPHPLNQLMGEAYVAEANRWLSLVVALCLAGLPFLVYRRSAWPRAEWMGLAAVVLPFAGLFAVPFIYPAVTAAAMGLVTVGAIGWPRLRLRWRAARLVYSIVEVIEAACVTGSPEPAALPLGGPQAAIRALSRPAVDPTSARAAVLTLCDLIVEAKAGKTHFERVPFGFFQRAGMLATAEDGEAAAGTHGKRSSVPRKHIRRADELDERFVGNGLRRIRNLWVHDKLGPVPRKLGYDALTRWAGRPTELRADEYLRLQRALSADVLAYLQALRAQLEGSSADRKSAS